MDKCLIPIFAIAMLAVFALPVSAMESNLPPAPDGNATPMLGAAPNGTEPGLPPMPGESPQMADGVKRNGTASDISSIQPRDQNIRDRVRNVTNAPIIREAINATNVKDRLGQRVKEFNEARRENPQRPMNNTSDVQSFILQAKAFTNTLNQTQRQQFNQLIFGFLNQSMDNRIEVAMKFGARKGTDNATITEFLNRSEELKAQIAAANSTQERRRLVNQANREWAAFKRDVVKEAARDRITNATDRAQAALDKLDAIIANLTANGTDTTKLENISARVQNRIDRAREQNITLRQSEWRLAFARDGLAHLAAQVKRAVKAQAIEEMPEKTEPAGLAVEDVIEQDIPAIPAPTTVANATASQ